MRVTAAGTIRLHFTPCAALSIAPRLHDPPQCTIEASAADPELVALDPRLDGLERQFQLSPHTTCTTGPIRADRDIIKRLLLVKHLLAVSIHLHLHRLWSALNS
jgi:hypothetical protein